MNTAQIHLALTHLPVVLSLVGMVALAFSFIKNNAALRRFSLYILIIAGLSALPVFFTGEGAEEVIENLPGVSEPLIEKHEDFALYGLISILAAAVLAIVTLLKFISATAAKSMAIVVFIVSLISTGMMAQTAHLGGQIRHTEIRSAALQQGNENINAENEHQENDND